MIKFLNSIWKLAQIYLRDEIQIQETLYSYGLLKIYDWTLAQISSAFAIQI